MKMKPLFKRITSVVLTLLMVLSAVLSPLPGDFFTRFVEAAETYVVKKEQLAQGLNVLPVVLADDEYFLNSYVRKNGTTMSINSSLLTVEKNDIDPGEYLTINTMGRKSNGNGQWQASFATAIPSHLKNDNYEIRVEAKVKADYHKNAFYNAYNHWDVGYVDLYGVQMLKADKSNDDEWQNKSMIVPGSRYAYKNELKVVVGHEPGPECQCGKSAVSGCTLYIVKTSVPYITNMYVTSDKEGNNKINGGVSFGTKEKETAYVVMEFSEDIRFSDNMGDKLSLNLDAYYTKNNRGVDKDIIPATLVSTESRKMVFEFSVPSKIDGNNTDIYISGISSEQPDFINGDFELKVYDKEGGEFSTDKNKFYVSNYITDLVGNPLNWDASTKTFSRVYFDNVQPSMSNISMSGSMVTPDSDGTKDGWDEGKNRSAVFAGVGDWVSFTMKFSESVKGFHKNNVYAYLSIQDATGSGNETIKLKASSHSGNTIYFDKLVITESMKKAGDRIVITGFEGLTGVTDNYGNPLLAGSNYAADLSTVSMKPSQGIYLDVDAPIIATKEDMAVTDDVYAPYASSVGEQFTFPLIFSENVKNASLGDTSQIDECPAEFALLLPGEQKAYSWYIDTNQSIDADMNWSKDANTGEALDKATKNVFYPMNGVTYYVHIQLDANTDYNYAKALEKHNKVCFEGGIYASVTDYAGNKTEEIYKINHPVDSVAPVLNLRNEADLRIDYDNLKASLTTSFDVSENYAIQSVTYQWTYKEADGVSVTKEPVTITMNSSDGLKKVYESGNLIHEFSFSVDSDTGRKGSAKLTVTAQDFAGNHVEETTKEFTYDFTQAKPHNVLHGGSPDAPLYIPQAYIYEPIRTSNDGGTEKSRTIMLIEAGKNEDGTTKYWGYDTLQKSGDDVPAYSELDLIGDICSDGISNAPGFWIELNGKIEDGKGLFERTNIAWDNDVIGNIKDYLTNMYGKVDILFVTSQDFIITNFNSIPENSYSFEKATSTVERHTVYLANHAEFEVAVDVVKDAQGQDAETKLNYVKGQVPFENLDNISVTLNLKNVTENESTEKYNLIPLLNDGDTRIELHYQAKSKEYSGYDESACIYTWPLHKAQEQTIVIPTGTAKEIGWYSLWVFTKNGNNTITRTQLAQRFFMDPTVLTMDITAYDKTYVYESIKYEGTAYERPVKESLKVREDRYTEENKDIHLALGTAPNEKWRVDTELTFKRTESDKASLYGIEELLKVRVYNKADAAFEENAVWRNVNEEADFTYIPVCVEEITKESYGTVDAPMLPLYEGDNIIRMELINTNGVVTYKEELVYVTMPYDGVTIEKEITEISDRTGGIMEVTVRPNLPIDVKPVPEDGNWGTGGEPIMKGEHSLFRPVDTRYEQYHNDFFRACYEFRADDSGEFWVADQNGNLYAQHIAFDGVDGEAPRAFVTEKTDGYVQSFCLNLQIYDRNSMCSADEITLTFDKDYSALLKGLTGEERTKNEDQITIKLPLNREKDADGNYLPWESYDTGNYGIYRTRICEETGPAPNAEGVMMEGNTFVEIVGTWKYDYEVENGEREGKDRTFTFTAKDENGNEVTTDISFSHRSSQPNLATGIAVEEGGFDWYQYLYEDGTLGIYSEMPYSGIHSYGAGTQKEAFYDWAYTYVYYTSAPMIQQDGKYIFEVTDLFGDHHKVELNVFAFNDLGIDVSFSETEETNQDVTVFATATLEGDYITSIEGLTEDGTRVEGTIDESHTKNASITMPQNGTVTIKTSFDNERVVPVMNIDKVLEPAKVVFYTQTGEELTGEETEVDDVVTAQVVCDEFLYGTNGVLSYNFLRGSKAGDSYVFEYQDAAGNTGRITAVLPCDIKVLPGEETDDDAPLVTVSTYGMRNQKYSLLGISPNADAAEISKGLNEHVAQEYRLQLTIEDISNTKIVVKNSGDAAPTDYSQISSESTVENVILSSNVITITENVPNGFDIYVMDENNNVTALTGIKVTALNKNAIEYYVQYQKAEDEEGYPVVEALFLPVNEKDELAPITVIDKTLSSKLVMTSQENPEYDPENDWNGEEPYLYAERYYYVFKDNGAYTFRYRDELGNLGEVVAQVQSMSTAAVVVEKTTWAGTTIVKTPDGNVEPVEPSNSGMVNKDITAELSMSKAISGVELYKYDGDAEDGLGEKIPSDAPILVSFTGKSIYVTYKENVDYKVAASFKASDSGRRNYYVLPEVTCIDKVAPVVTLKNTETAANNRKMKFTFATDEATLLAENINAGYTKNHDWTARNNVSKELRFSDKAGNITTYLVTENAAVDVTYLKVEYSISGSDADAVTDAVNDMKLDVGADFYIKTNKKAVVKINNVEQGTIQADTWSKYTLPKEAGVHILQLIDVNTGELLYDNLAAQPKDIIAPDIRMNSNSVIVLEGVSVEAMMQKVKEGITITDDMDGTVKEYSVTGYPDTVKAGLYTLTYKAQDAAGNKTIANRTLYIMKEGTPLLIVNGEAALPYGRTALSGKDIKLLVSGIGNSGEDLVIKWKSGMKTTAQMKHGATTVKNMEFAVPESGFYTIYVRTQDRVEYVTYLYVEE